MDLLMFALESFCSLFSDSETWYARLLPEVCGTDAPAAAPFPAAPGSYSSARWSACCAEGGACGAAAAAPVGGIQVNERLNARVPVSRRRVSEWVAITHHQA